MNTIANQPRRLAGAVARLDGPLVVVDVGAQALAHEDHVYAPLRQLGVPLKVIGFEPQADHAAARRALDGDGSLIMEAFIGDGATHRFYNASTAASSSLFQLDRDVCGTIASLVNLHDRPGEEIATATLDQMLQGVDAIDFLKLDIEGAELMALRGASDVLSRTAVVQAEAAFVAFRRGQPLFADLDAHMRASGFGFMRLHAQAMRAVVTPSRSQGADRMTWADAVYFAEEALITHRALLAQAILASGIYSMHTVAERLLALYDARHGTTLAADYVSPPVWSPGPVTLSWAREQTNAALRHPADIDRAAHELAAAGLPPHPDRPKCWDGFLATLHAVQTTPRNALVLDAGAERYSAFLPGLRRLGFTQLIGINTTFSSAEIVDGILYRPGDVTGSDLPDGQFGFVACLSVVEHGVDFTAFLREQARLLCPGGHLFMSCDYWETPIETAGLHAYGVPVRIFTREDLQAAIAVAESVGLQLVGPSDLRCVEKAVCWQRFNLHYTFANLLWRRVAT